MAEHKLWGTNVLCLSISRMLLRALMWAGVVMVSGCAMAVSNPGKTNSAIQADMASCGANTFTLHDPSVVSCLSRLGDTVDYANGRTSTPQPAAPSSIAVGGRTYTYIRLPHDAGTQAPWHDERATDADNVSDPVLRAAIGEVMEYYRAGAAAGGPNGAFMQNDYSQLAGDPYAKGIDTKLHVANALRGQISNGGQDWENNDAVFHHLVSACQFSRLVVEQAGREYPNVDANRFAEYRTDPDQAVAHILLDARMFTGCPTEQDRVARRARDEANQKAQAAKEQQERESEARAEAAIKVDQARRAAILQSPAGQQCESQCAATRSSCQSQNSYNFFLGPNHSPFGRMCGVYYSSCVNDCTN
jgi:hypothetical protein